MSDFGKGLRKIVEFDFNGKKVSLETGWLAKQADGAVLVRSGGNAVLVTAVSSTRESTMGFFPLTIEFSEKMYAAGKVPVFGILKRGGRVYTQIIPDAASKTLMPIIRDRVQPDSIVYSDCWRGYNVLNVSEFKRYQINRSKLVYV